jgi:hypothetical protein
MEDSWQDRGLVLDVGELWNCPEQDKLVRGGGQVGL